MIDEQLGLLLALLAALLWAVGPILAGHIIQEIGVMRFSRLRYLLATPIIGFFVLISGNTVIVSSTEMFLILCSSLFGLVVAETCFFQSIHLIGARRATLLQAFNIVVIVVVSAVAYDEALSMNRMAGIGLCFAGIVLAVVERTSRTNTAISLPNNRYKALKGTGLGLIAAVGQAAGILALRPVMEGGANIFTVTFLRVLFAAISTFLIAIALGKINEYRVKQKLIFMIAASAILSNILGTLALTGALSLASAAVVGTVSALSPVLIVPLVVLFKHERLSLRGLVGACIAVAGTVQLMLEK